MTSDSSEDEDLSRFKEAVDTTFVKLISESKDNITKVANLVATTDNRKSERYLQTSTHYNDVRVPEEMQKMIGAKISAIIDKNVEFVTLDSKIKKRKIKGGIKLFTNSEEFLSCEEVKDTFTEAHNMNSKKLKNQRRQVEQDSQCEEDKVRLAAISGDYIISKKETKCWKSRRKEKLFKYKANGKGQALTAIE